MDPHDEFTKWAVKQGVKINGIKAHRFEGKGLGIIAERRLEVCQNLLYLYFYQILLLFESRYRLVSRLFKDN